jgi:hypothetical protein
MGWSVGYDENWKRDIGYGVPSICDHPDCNKEIDRGLSYVCGGQPYGGEKGCGLYFCNEHLSYGLKADGGGWFQGCDRCVEGKAPSAPKPDTDEWIHHKATDSSWGQWRQEQKEAIA